MTLERLAQIEAKAADLRTVGNTPGANSEREEFLIHEVAELVTALRSLLATVVVEEPPAASPKRSRTR